MNLGSPGKRVVVSMHMEKCAGTSLDHLLRTQYGEGFQLFDPGPPGSTVKPTIPPDTTCLHGHMFYGLHDQFPDRHVDYITVLRDPRERFLSQFEHIRRYEHPLHTEIIRENGLELLCDLEEARHYRNLFVRRLSGAWDEVGPNELNLAEKRLRTFAVVGQVESMDSFVAACGHYFEWAPVKLGHANAAPGGVSRFHQLPAVARQAVVEANSLDLELWERTRDLVVR